MNQQEVKIVDETSALTVWDTQKLRALVKEVAAMVVEAESKKPTTKKEQTSEPKSHPYLIVILLMMLLGFGAVVLVVTLRKDLDFVIVSGGVFLLVTATTTSVFNIMKQNQTLQEAHEANVKAQLALSQSRDTYHIVNSRMDEFKEIFKAIEFAKGLDAGQRQAEARADLLAEKKSV